MKFREFLVGIVVPIVTAVTGVFVLFLNHSVQNIDNQLKQRQENRLDVQQTVDIRIHIYNAVVDSLNSPDPRKQKVATSLVINMLDANDSLRAGLLEVLTDHGDEKVKQDASNALKDANEFKRLQPTTEELPAAANVGSDWRGYNLDLFWCATSGDMAKAKAEKIVDALKSAGSTGRLRVRTLAATINATPGYQISGLVIRREPNEESVAQELKKIADAVSGDPNTGFALTNSSQGTPGYVSLFVCQ